MANIFSLSTVSFMKFVYLNQKQKSLWFKKNNILLKKSCKMDVFTRRYYQKMSDTKFTVTQEMQFDIDTVNKNF